MRKPILFLAALFAALLAAPAAPAAAAAVPLPKLAGPVRLTVAIADNPRFPAFDAVRLQRLFAAAERTVHDHFGIELELVPAATVTVAELFTRIPAQWSRRQETVIYDFKRGGGERSRLVAAMDRALRENKAPLAELAAYVRPYLIEAPREESFPALATALTDTLLDRLAAWRALPAADGRPVIDDTPYNEWALWDGIGYGELPWDVVITNQLIASAEYYDQDVHSAIRGGITVGTTSYSRSSRFGGYIFFSTFPYDNDQRMLVGLRGGERYSDDEAADLAGSYLAHEIGHLLLHLGHPYGTDACVMKPVELLAFRRWRDALAPVACRLNSLPAMKPGAIELYYSEP